MVDVQQYNTVRDAADKARPTGAWAAAPAIAATGVNMVNTSGKPVMVDITGGTITVISINGVATGVITGRFRLGVGDKIAITYSVIPTAVKWFYA
jgi:hypothetical protein